MAIAKRTTQLLILTGAALLPGLTVHAAEIEARSRIAAVMVFPEGAMVSRTVEIDVPQGASTLVFRGLPLTIDAASLRVEGQASGALQLGPVDSRLRPGDPGKAASEIEGRLIPLRAERERRAGVVEALEGRKAMIVRFGQSGPERGDKGSLDVGQWAAAWEAVGKALAEVNETLIGARRDLTITEAEIRALELAETQRRGRAGTPEREFTLALEAGQPVKGQLTLTYRVQGARWRPAYDAAFTSGTAGKGATLSLTRRALVSQRTGEDWQDVAMTLSTVQVSGSTTAPDMHGQRVSFVEYPMPVPMARGKAAMAEAAADRLVMAAPAAPASAAPVKARETEATVDSGDFQSVFQLPGAISLPTDGTQKSMVIQSRNVVPDVLIKAVPALDPTAYLQASFVNDDEAPLLAGEVSLLRDGLFIGRGRIGLHAPGERVSLGFGADDRVKVARIPVRRRETEPSLLGSTKSDTRDFKITVRNLHDFPVRLSIIDQLPYSEAANLTVEPLPTNTPPTEKTVEDRRGVMGWSFDLKAKEDREIRIGYRLRWPSDREVRFDRIAQPR